MRALDTHAAARIVRSLGLDQDAVPAFPLRLLRTPMLAEVIDFVFQRRFAFRLLPHDIA